MKTLSERNRILNEVKDSCYLAFFDGNPEEGGKEILTGRKKVNFPVATLGYVASTNQLDFTGGEEVTLAYGETSQNSFNGYQLVKKKGYATSKSDTGYWEPNSAALLTPLDNGWGKVQKSPTASSDAFANFFGYWAAADLVVSSVYTVIIELDNCDTTGSFDLAQPGVAGDPWASGSVTAVVGCQWRNGTNLYVNLNGENTPKFAVFKATVKSSQTTYAFRTFLRPDVPNGGSVNARISIISGDHSSDWQNYCGDNYEPYVGGIASPNPDYPQAVQNITIGNLELCGITEFKDYVYTENDKWYKHSDLGKIVLTGGSGENWGTLGNGPGGIKRFRYENSLIRNISTNKLGICCDRYLGVKYGTGAGGSVANTVAQWENQHIFTITTDSLTYSVADYKSFLSTHNLTIYYALQTPTDTEITDQATISALEEMFGYATGVAKYWGVYDSEMGGKLLYYYILPYEVRIVKDSTITIKAGNCILKEG